MVLNPLPPLFQDSRKVVLLSRNKVMNQNYIARITRLACQDEAQQVHAQINQFNKAMLLM